MSGPIRRALEDVRSLLQLAEPALEEASVRRPIPAPLVELAQGYALTAIAAGLGGLLERLADDEPEQETRGHTVSEPGELDADEAGRQAYDAYSLVVGGRDFRGDRLPLWVELGEQRRRAWAAAATWYRQ